MREPKMKISVNGLLMMSLVVSCAVSPAWAAERAPLTPEYVEKYIRHYKAEFSRREARVTSLTEQIRAIDEDLEYRVKGVVDMLLGVRDSVDSKSRVMGIKLDAIEALQKSIVYYGQERDRRLRALESPATLIEKDTLQRDVTALNKRIDERIEQIAQLTGSFDRNAEYRNNRRYTNNDINYNQETLEFRRHERLVSKGAVEVSRITEEMREAINRLRSKSAHIEHSMEMTISVERIEALTAEHKQVRDLIRKRQEQLKTILKTTGGATRPMAQRAAFEMDQHVDEVISEIRWDVNRLKSRIRERDTARSALPSIKSRLERAEAALVEIQNK
jgi:hypothetical protein